MSIRVLRPILCLALTLSWSCDRGASENPEPDKARSADGKGEKSSKATDAPEATGEAPTIKDPGPLFTRKTGEIKATQAPEIALTVGARASDERAAYVEVELPGDLDGIKVGRGFMAPRLIVKGERYGLAVPMNSGIVRDRSLFMVRFVGPEPAPDAFEVVWNAPADRQGQPGVRQVFKVSGGAAAESRATLPGQFHDLAGKWFQQRGRLGGLRSEPFYTFATARMQTRGALAAQRRATGARAPARAELADAMAFYTGITSIEEALQSDRGLRVQHDDKLDAVPIADVSPIDLPRHPWDDMIAKLKTAKATAKTTAKTTIEPLAMVVPNDVFYVHFHDLRTLVRIAKDMSELVSPLVRVLEERPGPQHFVERYEHQLGIERMGLSEKLGHLAAKGVALIASDPFFREGTDVAILFDLNNEALLSTALASYETRAKKRRPDATVSEYTLAGQTVRRFGTIDNAVNQHRVKLGNVLVLANSKNLVKRIVETTPKTALGAAGEFRYFRTLYPHEPEDEDGFIFIGDAFVNRVINPRTKILQARRMNAAADLRAVGFANLLYGWLNGKPAESTQALLESGMLKPSDLEHSRGGGTIEFDRLKGARSAWGTASALASLDSLPLTAVSERERGAYKRFKDTYQSYWRGFIDPVGIRIMRSKDGKTLSMDGQMLPLIARSDYREVEALVGTTRVEPGDWRDGIRFLFAVDEKASLRKDLELLSRTATGNRDLKLSWLGDWVMAGVTDHSGLWDAALVFGDVPQAGDRNENKKQRVRDLFQRIPLFAAAEVRDGLALAATLAALKGVVESVAPGMVTWGPDGEHAGVPIVKITEKIEGPERGALHYANVEKVLVLALDRGVLEGLIDTIKSGRRPKTNRGEAGPQAQLRVSPLSKDSWLAKTLAGMVERGNLNTQASARAAYEAVAVGMGWPKDAEAAKTLGLVYLGYAPQSPSGGTFSLNADGLVEHTLYGTELAPKWPKLPIAGSAAAKFLEVLGTLEMGLGFEGEGISRGLHTWAKWAQR